MAFCGCRCWIIGIIIVQLQNNTQSPWRLGSLFQKHFLLFLCFPVLPSSLLFFPHGMSGLEVMSFVSPQDNQLKEDSSFFHVLGCWSLYLTLTQRSHALLVQTQSTGNTVDVADNTSRFASGKLHMQCFGLGTHLISTLVLKSIQVARRRFSPSLPSAA